MEPTPFFQRHGPFPVSKIAQEVGASLAPGTNPDHQVSDVRPLTQAGPDHLTFLDNLKYAPALADTRAGACLLRGDFADKLPAGTAGLITDQPYHALARALSLFYPQSSHPRVCPDQDAQVHEDAQVEPGVSIEPGAIVGAQARIGAGARIAAGAVIGYGVHIGRDSYIGPNANITHALIGDQVIIHAGVSIGQDGFGFAMGPGGHLKVPQIGRVIIQDNVEIGANSAVDRGALGDTVIGEGTKIDNLVQIGHNVQIGQHCVIVGQVGISGSAVLEDFVVMGGQSGCVGHIRIGQGAQIAGMSGISHSVPAGQRWGGVPARPVTEWSREVALTKALSEMIRGKTLARLKKLLSEISRP